MDEKIINILDITGAVIFVTVVIPSLIVIVNKKS